MRGPRWRRASSVWWVTLITLLIVAGIRTGDAQTRNRAGTPVFTAAQADAGRDAFQTYCARCHLLERPTKDIPPLTGPAFRRQWGDRTPSDLFQYLQKAMPPDSPGDAGFAVDLGIIAFLLKANGGKTGPSALTPATAVPIREILGTGARP